jgi:enoyl-[acyl-carrier protein] reductase / trans-2-enoyl-CoA reductase (NAD+)
MIIKPKVRGFICTTSHPTGCAAHVKEQIEYVQDNKSDVASAPKNVLVIGCSTGYGLASRIVNTFGFGAKTMGVMFEKEPSEKRTGSAGWYNTRAFEIEAEKAGIYAKSFNMDAFSHEAKNVVIDEIKKEMGKVDLVVYSLASPRRKDPDSDTVYSSVLKPIDNAVTRKTLNTDSEVVHDITIEPANQDEIDNTIKVMGGEDWELWINALSDADVLAEGCQTTAYTYIGKELTWPIYGDATIGKAKEDLDRAAKAITEKLDGSLKGAAYVSVLKAIVTQSSSAIPVMPLYISLLYRVMKEQGNHEGCIEQIFGLYFDQFYSGQDKTLDETGRIRMDLPELTDDIQKEVEARWEQVTTENLRELSDYEGYQAEFFKLFGFGIDGVDYDADVSPVL